MLLHGCGGGGRGHEGRAGRVELCEDLPCGGVTPSRADIEAALKAVNIPVNVLIRVRGGDFVYDEAEIALITKAVEIGLNEISKQVKDQKKDQ